MSISPTPGDESFIRKIVVYQSGSVFPTQMLSDAGWAVATTSDAKAVKQIIAEHGARIGIAFHGNTHDANFDDVPFEWVAVLPESLRHRECRQFISNFCYDYHTMPICTERLLATLGHAHGKATMKARLDESASSQGFLDMEGTSHVMRELCLKSHNSYCTFRAMLRHMIFLAS